MKTEEEDNQGINKHSDDIFLKKCTSLFKNYHKFRTNKEIEIRVYQGAKGFTNQSIPFGLFLSLLLQTHLPLPVQCIWLRMKI